ncbi:Uncharacterized protein Fot_30115 [Forsythia ovata]|uniref:Uncharacterized protein n=1 Tax=Forsythia ovata TaxID=205694 RepID=A0ABD1TTT4_9LAMI
MCSVCGVVSSASEAYAIEKYAGLPLRFLSLVHIPQFTTRLNWNYIRIQLKFRFIQEDEARQPHTLWLPRNSRFSATTVSVVAETAQQPQCGCRDISATRQPQCGCRDIISYS